LPKNFILRKIFSSKDALRFGEKLFSVVGLEIERKFTYQVITENVMYNSTGAAKIL
jgi:hypothetical protein